MWWIYALLSALFAALTAILAKVGIKGVDTNLATAIRTVVILFVAWGLVFWRGGINTLPTLSRQNWLFLVLSGVAPNGNPASASRRTCRSDLLR